MCYNPSMTEQMPNQEHMSQGNEQRKLSPENYKLTDEYTTLYGERNKIAFRLEKSKEESALLQQQLSSATVEEVGNKLLEKEKETQQLQKQIEEMDQQLAASYDAFPRNDLQYVESEYPPKQQTEEEFLADIEDWTQYTNTVTHPEYVQITEGLRESGPEIEEFERMLISFESDHSLEALHAITELTSKDSGVHPVREPARLALIPINTKLEEIKKETNISDETYQQLRAKYKVLGRAVGIISGGKLDHTR